MIPTIRGQVIEQSNTQKVSSDELTARLEALRKESVPKPITGPPIAEDLAPILGVFLAKSEFLKTMTICEKYPTPSNLDTLSIPELPIDANKIIDQRAVNTDNRFKNDQKCTAALFGSLAQALDIVLKLRGKVPELGHVGDLLLDSLQMTGFLHQDFTTIRLKGVKQTVNPSYGDVVSQKPEEPGMLLGKTPLGEQMKSCDEFNKLKAKFKKPDPQPSSSARKQDFRKGGEYKRKQMNTKGFRPKNRERRDDRRTGYYSPKGNYRRNQQQDANQSQFNKEERRNQNSRKN